MNGDKENISLSQLLTLLINFLLGSAIVVGVGGSAKNDAWLAILLGGLLGMGIISLIHFFVLRFPDKNIFQVFEFCIGRKITIVCSFMYIVYFLYISSRVIRDFGELMATAILPNTPIEMMSLTFCLLMGYIIYLGIEVLARTSEVFTPYIFVFFILLAIFLFVSGSVDFKQIQPILGEGIMPVITTAFTELTFFPFGEMIAFSVIYASLTNKKYSLRVSIVGVGIATLLLSVSSLLMIVSLGVDSVVRSNFPLLSTARVVSIGKFIERIDAFVVFIIMLGVFIKGSLFFYAGLKGLEYIFNLPYRYFALPVSTIISLFSILVSVDFADHIQEGLKMVPYYLHFPFQVVFPFILFLLVMWKQWKGKSKSQKSASLKLHTQLNSFVESWGGDPNIRLNDFIQAYTSAGRRGVMSALTIQGDPEKGESVENMKKIKPEAIVVVDSLAIFKHDKLLDFLPLEDSRNYLWITNKLVKTVLTVDCSKDKSLGVRIFNTMTKSKASLIKGRAVINLKVSSEAYLDSTVCKEDLNQIKYI